MQHAHDGRRRPARLAALALAALATAAGVVASSPEPVHASPAAVDVVRISGADRFETSVAISRSVFGAAGAGDDVGPERHGPREARVVYLVDGRGFADALSAAPAAAHLGGPLLLSETRGVPDVVLDEVRRLDPQRVVVVGGERALSARVLEQATAAAPGAVVERIGGANRYETSRRLAADAFLDDTWQGDAPGRPDPDLLLVGPGPFNTESASFHDGTTFVATGESFPDALVASAAAGAHDTPLVLVRGSSSTVDQATQDLLVQLQPRTLRPVGGPAVLDEGIVRTLEQGPFHDGRDGAVSRLFGQTRYDTAAQVGWSAFSTPGGWSYGLAPHAQPTAFVATGQTFPDALAGAAAAGYLRQPLFTSRPDCVPSPVAAALDAQGRRQLVLLGGPAALADRVADTARPC